MKFAPLDGVGQTQIFSSISPELPELEGGRNRKRLIIKIVSLGMKLPIYLQLGLQSSSSQIYEQLFIAISITLIVFAGLW